MFCLFFSYEIQNKKTNFNSANEKKNAHSKTEFNTTTKHINSHRHFLGSFLFGFIAWLLYAWTNKKGTSTHKFNERKWNTIPFCRSKLWPRTENSAKTIKTFKKYVCFDHRERDTESETEKENKQIALPIGSNSFITIESTFLVTKTPYSPNTLF